MKILVADCSHWIGFHITNALLENDYQVDGVRGENKNEHLEMFFARNSNFTFTETNTKTKYDAAVIAGRDRVPEEVEAERIFVINGSREKGSRVIPVYIPYLFGEWIPMQEEGFYQGEEFISFASQEFREGAVDIKDAAKGLLQLLKAKKLPEEIILDPSRKGEKLENLLFLRNNRPIERSLKTLQSHYQQYKGLY
ncbi:hypothetical protein [Lentibacillus sediminis]|uniref:hypothetical protein n=1 Tax=Lentibacillus sediminis TaxID=1940529 RepID=UPI000C1BC07D|nr:hypothetical protein [Lentibacillus sediminis]